MRTVSGDRYLAGDRAPRPLYVRQQEAGPNASNVGDFWYVVATGNGETILTSKMYRTRARAVRAARKFIARVSGRVVFTYRTGPTSPRIAELLALGRTNPFARVNIVEQRFESGVEVDAF